jgi:hypothetical protein
MSAAEVAQLLNVTPTMTTPFERTQALLRTRDLLKALATGEDIASDTLRRRAESLLKHFPRKLTSTSRLRHCPGFGQP